MGDDDIVIAYANPLDMSVIRLKAGGVLNNKYGSFAHDIIIGKPFGSRIASKKGNGHICFLAPTPELWTSTLPHRTQILYMPDIALVSEFLDLRPGKVVVESGTGSGSFSHSIARTIAPTGTLYTFEYHAERAAKFIEEIATHSLTSVITPTHRNVCKDGFGLTDTADAVFLDLPSPWEAVAFAKETFKKGRVGRLCSFSPAIEQVQRTCEELEKCGFADIRMFETLIRRQDVKTLKKRSIPTRDSATGLVEKNDTKKDGGKKRKRAIKLSDDSADGEDVDNEDEEAAEDEDGNSNNDEDESEKLIVSRTIAKVAGHTSFLVFASIFIDQN
ncbi:tRNA (adenine(58)-N(1))-methyltransferase catalytic subunit trmt61a [Physocladia obscura]|uniref:tRNA (adenine(58)-N(1))-methyltransferase catalytic subunit TRM61 n=1 Tax=Physocladia obscura TaxID=109957 RepID=A0AAD5XAP7_9FUNG|nr:tRNA (adenine(58)-N(1))-methyltransferase catalytic subunit trmt61a [Physocladia obscura]